MPASERHKLLHSFDANCMDAKAAEGSDSSAALAQPPLHLFGSINDTKGSFASISPSAVKNKISRGEDSSTTFPNGLSGSLLSPGVDLHDSGSSEVKRGSLSLSSVSPVAAGASKLSEGGALSSTGTVFPAGSLQASVLEVRASCSSKKKRESLTIASLYPQLKDQNQNNRIAGEASSDTFANGLSCNWQASLVEFQDSASTKSKRDSLVSVSPFSPTGNNISGGDGSSTSFANGSSFSLQSSMVGSSLSLQSSMVGSSLSLQSSMVGSSLSLQSSMVDFNDSTSSKIKRGSITSLSPLSAANKKVSAGDGSSTSLANVLEGSMASFTDLYDSFSSEDVEEDNDDDECSLVSEFSGAASSARGDLQTNHDVRKRSISGYAYAQKESVNDCTESDRLRVHFSTVTVRVYEQILGDNPSCVEGPAMSLGWKYMAQPTVPLDLFERVRVPVRLPARDLQLSSAGRFDLAAAWGYSQADVTQAIRLKAGVTNGVAPSAVPGASGTHPLDMKDRVL